MGKDIVEILAVLLAAALLFGLLAFIFEPREHEVYSDEYILITRKSRILIVSDRISGREYHYTFKRSKHREQQPKTLLKSDHYTLCCQGAIFEITEENRKITIRIH